MADGIYIISHSVIGDAFCILVIVLTAMLNPHSFVASGASQMGTV